MWPLLGLLVVLGFIGTKATKKVVENIVDKANAIKKLREAASVVSSETGIPVELIVTQAAHESNYGRSGLATKDNNLFGIKANNAWIAAGKPFSRWPTWEVVGGKEISVESPFRKYSTWTESIRDWAKFLQGPRYSKAYASLIAGDASQFFYELKAAGYATDPKYPEKLLATFNNLRSTFADA